MRDRHEIDFAQRLLPPGLALIEQLAVPAQHGLAFKAEDRRLVSSPPVVRLIRVVEARATEAWRDKWLSQLRELSKNVFLHVCRPLEMGVAGADHVYLVLDWFPATLAEQIPATGLVSSRVAQSILRQLVAGLEELHGRLGAHGGLRAEHVFVDSNSLNEESRVWIGGVEFGHLPYWTDGARLVAGSHELFPPEWQGTLHEPKKSADVFALGLLAVELLAGRDARVRVAATPNMACECASLDLKQRWPWWKRPKFVPALLSQAKQRPADGPAVKRSFDWWDRCEGIVRLTSAVVAALLLTTVGIGWHEGTLRSDRDSARDQAVSAERSLRAEKDHNGQLMTETESLRGEFAKALTEKAILQKRLDELVDKSANLIVEKLWSEKLASQPIADHDAILKSLAGQTSVKGHEQLAAWSETVKQAWYGINHSSTAGEGDASAANTGRKVAYDKLSQEPWNKTRQSDLMKAFWHDFASGGKDPAEKLEAITAVFEKVPPTSWLRAELSAYVNPLVARHSEWQRWETQPPELTQPWRKRIEIPWDAAAISRDEEMLDALVIAEREWRTVDGRGDLTWSEFQTQLNTAVVATGNPSALTVSNVWINQFNSMTGTSVVSIQLAGGTSPKGCGVFRTVDVHVDGSQFPLNKETTGHNWADETTHTYPATAPPISTPWRPGQTFQIKVYGARQSLYGGARPLFINKTFIGPIAVWRLAQAGTIATGKHSMTLRVTNCPGPPPRPAELKKVMEALK